MTKGALEKLSKEVGIPITQYINNRFPVINGKKYKSFKRAYGYLYSQKIRKKGN